MEGESSQFRSPVAFIFIHPSPCSIRALLVGEVNRLVPVEPNGG